MNQTTKTRLAIVYSLSRTLDQFLQFLACYAPLCTSFFFVFSTITQLYGIALYNR